MGKVNYVEDITNEEILSYGFSTLQNAREFYPKEKNFIKFYVDGKNYYFSESECKKFYLGKYGFRKEIKTIC